MSRSRLHRRSLTLYNATPPPGRRVAETQVLAATGAGQFHLAAGTYHDVRLSFGQHSWVMAIRADGVG